MRGWVVLLKILSKGDYVMFACPAVVYLSPNRWCSVLPPLQVSSSVCLADLAW